MSESRALTDWIGFKTIIIREFSRIVRIWGQTIVPPAVTATLYFVIFGSLIGRRVGQVGGFDYMQFMAPGIIMMNVIQTSYGNVVSSFFGAKFGKHIEELLVSPLPNWLIVAGYTMGGVLRGVLVGAVVTVISLFFTRLSIHHVLRDHLRGLPDQFYFCAGRIHQRAVCQEFRPDLLVSHLRTDPAHLPRGRVLFGHHAAGLGARGLERQSHFVHGERVPLRLSRQLGRRFAPGLCHYDFRRRRDVCLGGNLVESRHRHPRMKENYKCP